MADDRVIIDMFEANDFLRLAMETLAKAEGWIIEADPSAGRTLSQSRADASRPLIFAAHLCEKAKVAIMDQYFAARGEKDHL